MGKLASALVIFALAFLIGWAVIAVNAYPRGVGSQLGTPATYGMPSPSFWPSMIPPGHRNAIAQPSVRVSPCPSWAPRLVRHSNDTYECLADVPPDNGQGPCIAAPDGPPYHCETPKP